MAIQTEPTRIQIPFADSGTKNVIPDTNSTPSASQAASWTDGFPAQCSLPLSAGGIPPARADFNGIFNTMSQSIRFGQEGGVWAWDATVDYGINRVVLGSDGLLYWSVAQSGPNVGGAQDPTTDVSQTYWAAPQLASTPSADISSAAVTSAWVNNWYDQYIVPSSLYLDAVNGDDNNNGFTSVTAKKTYASLHSFLTTTNKRIPEKITVYFADGTYSENIEDINGVDISIIGASTNTKLTQVYAWTGGIVRVGGAFTFSSRVESYGGSSLYLLSGLNLVFASGSYSSCLRATGARIVKPEGANLTLQFSGVTVSVGTFECRNGGVISFGSGANTMSGTVTGKRYSCVRCSGITGMGSTTAIPGTVAGTIEATCYYT